jgi:hypothetical protein
LATNKSLNSRRELLKLLEDNVWSTYEPESEEGKLFGHLKTASFHFDGDKGPRIVFMIEKFLKSRPNSCDNLVIILNNMVRIAHQ